MTEEIIIDGVNVNACRFFTEDLFHPLTNSDCSAHCTPYPECACYDTCDEHPDCYYKQLKRLEFELQRYKDMEKQGLEEFKDIGGCWGCGLKLQLDQDLKDIKELKQENERLIKNDCEKCKHLDLYMKYKSALEEIRDESKYNICGFVDGVCDYCENIVDKINEVLGNESN